MLYEEAIAREDIRRATHDYMTAADAFFSGESTLFDEVLETLTEDVIVEFAGFKSAPPFVLSGRSGMREMSEAWVRPTNEPDEEATYFVRHNITTSKIWFSNEGRARAKTCFMIMTSIGLDSAGVYNDELVRIENRWLFSHRRIVLNWRAQSSRFPPPQ